MKTIFNTSKKKKLLAQESRVGMFFVNSWLIFFALISLIPMAWLLLAPSKTDEEVVNNAPLSFGNFKGYFNAWNNLRFFDDGVIQQWVVNSVVFNIAIVIIATATASLAGFVLSASRIRFKRVWLISTLIMMLIPPVALVVPLFVLMDQVGLVDNPLSVILISSLYPFGTFLSYIYY
jgi:multiple sugar transport system permease protein